MMRRFESRRSGRTGALAVALLLHVAAIGSLIAVRSTPTSDAIVVDMPIYYPPAVAPKLGGGGGVATKSTAKVPKKNVALVVEPQVIVASPTPTTGFADVGPPGPGSLDGRPDSECIENCTKGGLPGFPSPVPIEGLGIVPIPLFQPAPAYPMVARAAGVNGVVVVEIVVGVDGTVTSARVVKGQAPFDAPALESVRRWRYKPVLVDGQPILWKINVTLRFQLR